MYCMNFSNVNTGTAYNVRMSFFEYVLFNLGFKNYIINKVIDEWNINEEINRKIISKIKLITPDNSVIPSLNVANKIIINKSRVGASFHILIKKEDFLI